LLFRRSVERADLQYTMMSFLFQPSIFTKWFKLF
jgi:hypothetical protein